MIFASTVALIKFIYPFINLSSK